MALKPNRPVRVGTQMMTTNAKGEIPKKAASVAEEAEKAPANKMEAAPANKAAPVETVRAKTSTKPKGKK